MAQTNIRALPHRVLPIEDSHRVVLQVVRAAIRRQGADEFALASHLPFGARMHGVKNADASRGTATAPEAMAPVDNRKLSLGSRVGLPVIQRLWWDRRAVAGSGDFVSPHWIIRKVAWHCSGGTFRCSSETSRPRGRSTRRLW